MKPEQRPLERPHTPRALMLAAFLLMSAPVVPQDAAPVQGFVSGELVQSWCGADDVLDNEACLGYLRGVFDTLQAVRHLEHRTLVQDAGGNDAICVSSQAPVTQLKRAAQRYGARQPAVSNQQGAVFVLSMLRDTYPC